MRPRVRELFGAERIIAADLVRTWGYPRELELHELVTGHWFEWGSLAIFWIVREPDDEKKARVHVRSFPGSLGATRYRSFHALLLVLADLLGIDSFGGRVLEPRLYPILRRSGWTQDGERWILDVRE